MSIGSAGTEPGVWHIEAGITTICLGIYQYKNEEVEKQRKTAERAEICTGKTGKKQHVIDARLLPPSPVS